LPWYMSGLNEIHRQYKSQLRLDKPFIELR
jgi:hypothetical protein